MPTQLHDFISSSLFVPVLIAVGLVAFVYLYIPLKIKAQQSRSRHANYVLASHEDPLLTPEAKQYVDQTSAAFLENGFELLTYLKHQEAGIHVVSFVVLLAHDATGRLAQIAFVAATPGPDTIGTIKSTGIILETYYADGFVVQSSTFPERRVFASRPGYASISFHGFLSSAGDLLRLHAVLDKNLGHGQTKPSGASKDPVAFMSALHEEVMNHQVARGRYVLDGPAATYRPTLLGAYLMTWRMLPPLKQLTQASAQRQARYWLAKARATGAIA